MRRPFFVFTTLFVTLLFPSLAGPATSKPKAGVPQTQIHQTLGNLPLLFEPNRGQTDPRVRFLVRAMGITSFLTDRENVMVLSRGKDHSVVRMKLEGSNSPRRFEGFEKSGSVSNYYRGQDSSKWISGVPNYRKVRAQGVYPGIDLVYYGDGRQLEYDFVVHAGADPNAIRLAYSGAEVLTTDTEGNLLIATSIGTVIQKKPKVYQEFGSVRREIEAAYAIRNGHVEFALANWDRKRDLIIDPTLIYSTYVGGNASDVVYDLFVDASGIAYIAGYTTSTNFPTLNPLQPSNAGLSDAFVTKLNPDGRSAIYSTYLGGAGDEKNYYTGFEPNINQAGITADPSGNADFVLTSASTDFPVTPNAFQSTLKGGDDIVVVQLGVSGTLQYSTYLGGSGQDYASDIAADPDGFVYITGGSRSGTPPFPTTAGAISQTRSGDRDAIVAKLNPAATTPAATLVYSTFLGGSGSDMGMGITLDANRNVYVTGFTNSPNFPASSGFPPLASTAGSNDAFVVKINPAGSAILYSKLLGGSGSDRGYGIALDSSNAVYLTGVTRSADFPVSPGAPQPAYGGNADANEGRGGDAFVAKLDASGTVEYSTYLGGSDDDQGFAIAVSADGSALVTGITASTPFSTATCFQGVTDAFVVKLNPAGTSVDYATYLGGTQQDQGRGIAVLGDGSVYVGGYTVGSFPTTPAAFQATPGGIPFDGFLTKLVLTPQIPTTITVSGSGDESTPVNTEFSAPLRALVTDNVGQPVPGVQVTFTVTPGPGGASAILSSTITINTGCDGVASVTTTANAFTGSYDVRAASPVGSITFHLTNTAGTPAAIAFETQPADTPAGVPISTVRVSLRDESHNPVSGATVTLTLQGGGGVLEGTPSQVTGADGIASFSDLHIARAGTYTLLASSAGLTVGSNTFQIGAGPAVTITALSGSGQTAGAGGAYPEPLKAHVHDALGNPVSGVSVTFHAPASGPSVIFAGNPVVTTDSQGIATSPGMTANGSVGAFSVAASTPGPPSAASFSLVNSAGTASKLAFVQQPSDTVAGAAIAPPVMVQIQDNFGNPVHTPGISVLLQVQPVAVSGLQGLRALPAQTTDSNGLATFANLSVEQAGQYLLLALASGYSSAGSNPFTVRAGAPAAIDASSGSPQSALVSTAFARPLQVTVRDQFGNPVAGIPVNFVPPVGGASASVAPSATTDVNGRASVTATANAIAGSYAVTATAGSVGPANFLLTNTTGAPGQIAFTQQPTSTVAGVIIVPPVVVRVADGAGNPVANAPVTIAVDGGTPLLGTLTGTTDANGQATFGDLRINTAGTYQLVAASGAISGVSAPFQISASVNSVVVTVYEGDNQSALAGATFSSPLSVRVTDPLGNPIGSVQVTFTAPITDPLATFGGSPTATVSTGANGVAVSPVLTAGSGTGLFQVSASTPNAAAPAVFHLAILSSGSNRLSFVQQPTTTVAGQIVSPPVTVQLQDSSGTPLHTANVPISIQSNVLVQQQGLMSGNATVNTDGNGLATFSNLSLPQAGTYQLHASATTAASATSTAFIVTSGTGSTITATGGSLQSAFVLTVFSSPLQVAVTDPSGNPAAGVQVLFIAPGGGPSGLFNGQSTFSASTDSQGRASAIITANSIPGNYTVVATATAVTGSATFPLTNLSTGSPVPVFVTQPSNTPAGQIVSPPVTVQIRDSAGRPVNSAGGAVALTLASGTGSLTGTLVVTTDATGTATFNDLRISTVGTKQLRASLGSQAATVSNSFQITAGAAAVITAIAGTPQSTNTGEHFPTQLQAQVTDTAGNPVSGASVTFAVPSSGPSGTFAGAATVPTNSNGIATSPVLTANTTVGVFTATASVSGVAGAAGFSLVILPAGGRDLTVDTPTVDFASQSGQAPAAQTVQLTSTTPNLAWTATSNMPWLVVSPTSGVTPAQPAISVNPAGLAPGLYTGVVTFTSASGTEATLVTYRVTGGPALAVSPLELVFTTSSATITPVPQTLSVTATSGVIAYSVSAEVSSPAGGSWLHVSPVQGQTPGTLQVSITPAGLDNGIFQGSILITPTGVNLSPVRVPVSLLVGCAPGGCPSPRDTGPVILSVVNAASFHPNGAPAAIMTIFGRQLSDAIYQATTYPLPTQLGPTRVLVNGAAVPLFYVSPGQINFQMPSTTPIGTPQVVVDTGLLQATSSGYPAALSFVDPGLFVTPDKRASALNQDLSIHTAATPQPAGALILLYLTGNGLLTPPLPDGTAAPSSPLSPIGGTTQVTIGGKTAVVMYAGEAPGFAGLSQINAVIPVDLAPGDQPVFVSISGLASNAGLITVR